MFIHMFFVNVQSCSVLNACYIWIRYSVIQSCFLSTMPPFSCRQIFMIFLTRTSIFAWVNNTISLLCVNHQLRCCNPAVVRLLTAPKIPVLWLQSLGPICSPDSHISTYAFWHDPLLPVSRFHHWLFDLTSGRLTVLSEPSSLVITAMHPHHRPSCILRAPHPSETHACRSPTTPSRSLPPSALQPRLYGASHHFKRLRASSHRVERHFTPPTRSSSSASSPARERPFHRFPYIVHVLR